MGPFRFWATIMMILASVDVLAGTFSIEELSEPLRVDGHLEDWPAARMFLLDRPEQVVIGKGFWRKEEDASARVFLAYDRDYLHLAALVKKKGRVVNDNPAPALWNGDSLELFLATDPKARRAGRLSRGDFHLGFSPGTEAGDPKVYCFNKDQEVQGARMVPRLTQQGYLFEAAIPLDFFAGLRIEDERITGFNLVLNQGGDRSQRLFRMNWMGSDADWREPDGWAELEWRGTAVVAIPGAPPPSILGGGIEDGVQGATFLGIRKLQGQVVDPQGKALIGVEITTWPLSKKAVTDAQGRFELAGARIYDRTLVGAALEGRRTAWVPQGSLVKERIVLRPLPDRTLGKGGLSLGWVLEWPSSTEADWPGLGRDSFSAGGILLLSMEKGVPRERSKWAPVLEKFLGRCRDLKAEPWIRVPPGDPGLAVQWLRFVNAEKKYDVRHWDVGSGSLRTGSGGVGVESLHGLINGFRSTALALKGGDPSVLVLGPGLEMASVRAAMDQLVPFLRFDGDALDLVSVRRPALLEGMICDPRSVADALRADRGVLRGLQDRISENLDRYLPLIVTGGGPCEIAADGTPHPSDPGVLRELLWMAERAGFAFQEGVGTVLFDRSSFARRTPGPDHANLVLGLLRELKGSSVPAQVRVPDLSAFASRDPGTGDVFLLILNKGDRYRRVRIRLDGHAADISVEAGVGREWDHEADSHSIALVRIPSGRREAEMFWLDRRAVDAGHGVESRIVKLW